MAVLPAQMLPMGGVGGSMGIFGRGAQVLADVRVWQRRAASARAPIAGDPGTGQNRQEGDRGGQGSYLTLGTGLGGRVRASHA
jgi:hypothetical protein